MRSNHLISILKKVLQRHLSFKKVGDHCLFAFSSIHVSLLSLGFFSLIAGSSLRLFVHFVLHYYVVFPFPALPPHQRSASCSSLHDNILFRAVVSSVAWRTSHMKELKSFSSNPLVFLHLMISCILVFGYWGLRLCIVCWIAT